MREKETEIKLIEDTYFYIQYIFNIFVINVREISITLLYREHSKIRKEYNMHTNFKHTYSYVSSHKSFLLRESSSHRDSSFFFCLWICQQLETQSLVIHDHQLTNNY